MNEPPDRSPSLGMNWDSSKTRPFSSIGPKYLIMTRKNSQDNLTNVSPFLIKKGIDYTCGSQVIECKKMRNGSVLIKTKNAYKATKLLTLTALSSNIEVDISEHKTLNCSKGVIYCNDLRGISETEILSELKDQNVTEVKKIIKKANQQLVETGLVIVTFSTIELPKHMYVGYQKVSIRPYIPLPMRCNNCYKYGHIAKYCKAEKTCFNCSKPYHLLDEDDHCSSPAECANCSRYELQPNNHPATSKICPVFIKYKEIQAIKTINKVDNRTAQTMYENQHKHNATPYSTVVKSTIAPLKNSNSAFTPPPPPPRPSNATSTLGTTTSTYTTPNSAKRQLPGSYSDLNSESDDPNSLLTQSPSTSKKIVKIYPKNLPKRLQNQIKKQTL